MHRSNCTSVAALASGALVLAAPAWAQQSSDPSVGSWRRNLDGTTSKSEIAAIDTVVSVIEADVQAIHFDTDYAYIESTGVPSHTVGPFPGNPGVPGDQAAIVRIPRNPVVETGTKTATPVGSIGTLVNGVSIFNALDTFSWEDEGIWEQNALFFEYGGLDSGLGHPAMDHYHYHSHPPLLRQQLGDNGVDHSPILGFGFDGFPIYGPFGYANTDGTGGVTRMIPGWQERSMTDRSTLADGTVLAADLWGPELSQFPLGAYVQDFEYTAGSGHLDEHNGRFCVTPEYPNGTYAYFATIDAVGEPAYPYLIGPTYYGVVDDANLGGGGPPGGGGPGGGGPGGGGPGGDAGVTIPDDATAYAPFSIYENDFEVGANATVAFGDAEATSVLLLGVSVTGPGPIASPIGSIGLEDPVVFAGPFTADGAGFATVSFAIPASLAGVTIYSQAVEITVSTLELSNAARVLVP